MKLLHVNVTSLEFDRFNVEFIQSRWAMSWIVLTLIELLVILVIIKSNFVQISVSWVKIQVKITQKLSLKVKIWVQRSSFVNSFRARPKLVEILGFF